MFFAKQLKPGQMVEVTPEDGGEMLHLSQVCMSKPVDGNRSYLKVIQGSQSFAACVLQKDKSESCSVDIFLSAREGIKLAVEGGKNELSVIGYFEPEPESESDDNGHMGAFGEDSEEESEDEDISEDEADGMSAPVIKGGRIEDLDALEAEAKSKKQAGNKKALKAAVEEDEDESGDNEEEGSDDGVEGSDDDQEGSDDEEGSDEEEGSEEESEEEPAAAPQEKRKGQQQQQQQGNKKAKTQGGTASASKGDDAVYKNALVDFLKKNGRTPLASLGQKVKKPAGVEMKMAAFLKSKPDVFTVDGGFCSLK